MCSDIPGYSKLLKIEIDFSWYQGHCTGTAKFLWVCTGIYCLLKLMSREELPGCFEISIFLINPISKKLFNTDEIDNKIKHFCQCLEQHSFYFIILHKNINRHVFLCDWVFFHTQRTWSFTSILKHGHHCIWSLPQGDCLKPLVPGARLPLPGVPRHHHGHGDHLRVAGPGPGVLLGPRLPTQALAPAPGATLKLTALTSDS